MNVTKPVTIAVSCALALTACKKSVSVDTKRHRSGDNSKALLITGKNNKSHAAEEVQQGGHSKGKTKRSFNPNFSKNNHKHR